jgi:hypothetical protein
MTVKPPTNLRKQTEEQTVEQTVGQTNQQPVSAQTTGNPEIDDIGTHMAGATDMHLTRHSKSPVQIDPPVVLNPGPYDTRTGAYDAEGAEESKE